MELKVNEVKLPEQILFNYEELRQELTEKVKHYETLVYTDEQIKDAKADKAALNKLKKALNDERIRREKEYMQPFNDFKAKINEIISIIDKPVALIDKQVKEYEDKQKQEKMERIKELWAEMEAPDGLTLDKVFDERMLNVSYGMSHVKQKMLDDIKRFNSDIETLSNLPEFSFEATEVYKTTLDINKAITEAKRMSEIAKKKAEQEAQAKARAEAEEQARLKAEAMKDVEEFENNMQAQNEAILKGCEIASQKKEYEKPEIVEMPEQAEKQWVSFSALLSVEDATALKEFFKSRDIEFKAV